MSERRVPKIRFQGFNDAWEQRKLKDLFVFKYGDGNNNPSNGGPYPVFGAGGIQGGYTDFNAENSVIIGHMGDAGCVSWGEGKHFVTYNGTITVPKDDIFSSKFGYYLLSKMNLKKYRGGSGLPFLTYDMLNDMNTFIPVNKLECVKIAECFTSIDGLITLHQQECDKWKELKKGLLQKMFPKEGESMPEIRFPGFTDPWGQCKFSEGVSEIGDGLHGTPIYSDGGNIYFINGNNLVDGKIVISLETKKVDANQQSDADKSLDDTTILMSINGTIGNLAYYSGEKLMLGKSAAYIKVSEFDKRFVYAYLQAPSVRGYFMDNLTGTTIKNLGLKAIREMKILIPQDVEEQKWIGEFFDNLDKFINFHRCECDKWKELKKGLLQQMFVA